MHYSGNSKSSRLKKDRSTGKIKHKNELTVIVTYTENGAASNADWKFHHHYPHAPFAMGRMVSGVIWIQAWNGNLIITDQFL
jgi:hypothetical protein